MQASAAQPIREDANPHDSEMIAILQRRSAQRRQPKAREHQPLECLPGSRDLPDLLVLGQQRSGIGAGWPLRETDRRQLAHGAAGVVAKPEAQVVPPLLVLPPDGPGH